MKLKRNKFKALSKPKQKGIKVTGQWKPIEIDPNLFADEELGGIICFEELTNYQLVSSLKEGEEKSTKRKFNDEELEKVCPTTPPKKRKKRKNLEHEERRKDELEVEEKVIEQDASCKKALVKYERHDYEPTEVTSLERKPAENRGKKKKSCSPQNLLEPAGASKKANNWAAKALSTKSDHKMDVSAWKSLFVPKPVLSALSELGFSTPTPIQALTLPSAIRDSMDILGAAETGSGKTLAFAIPMIHSIVQWYSSKNMTSSTFEETVDGEDEMAKQHTSEEMILSSDTDETNAPEDDNESVAVNSMELLQDSGFDVGSPKQNTVKDKNNPLLGLVLTPTRELAVQVKHHIDAVAKFTDIKTAILVGGMAPQKQQRMLKKKPEIVVATPGRLWELIREKQPHLSNLRQLRCLVIDEADRMVERGHFLELSQLLEMLSDTKHNPKRQTFVFSATLTLIHQAPTRVLQKKNAIKIDRKTKLEMLMQKVGIKGKPKVIDLTRKEATVENLTETRIHCDTEEKDYYLYYFLLQHPGRTMVFANSIDCIKRLTALLTIMDCNPLPLHANMHQKQRLKNLERFAERNRLTHLAIWWSADENIVKKVSHPTPSILFNKLLLSFCNFSCPLLTTDVAARGLDIPYVQHVIHYQVPRTSELYVHRSGRTARAANEGLSLLLIGPHDLINYKKIYKTLKKDEELPFFPVEAKYMTAIKERVNLARQIEKIEYFNSQAKHQNSWLQQAAEALELDLDDDVLTGGQFTEQEESEKHRMLKGMKKQLKCLLSQPVFKGLMKTKYPTQSGKLVLSDYIGQHSQSALSAISKVQVKKAKKKQ